MKKYRILWCMLCVTAALYGQEALKSVEEEYYDFLSLSGSVVRPTLGYRTLSDSVWNLAPETTHLWAQQHLGKTHTLYEATTADTHWFSRGIDKRIQLKWYGPEWYNSYNSETPYGQNDGALWQGKGYNTSITAGARLEGFGFAVTLKPQISFSQNTSFALIKDESGYTPANAYGYYQRAIDFPQRFGDAAFWTFDWGDSEIRWSWNTLTVGFGTQIPWLSPIWLNPMLGSNNAASYPKLDMGLRKTALYVPHFHWYVGDIEGRIWLGRLEESDYFDANPDNDYRMLTALSASFAPAFIPGLTVGINRIFLTRWDKKNITYIGRLFTTSHANGSEISNTDDEDQKVSLFADWQHSKIGFEVYGELGFDDFTSDDVSNPFHTAIYTVGVKQITPLPVSWLKGEIISEWNNFEMSQDFQLQWAYTGYYSHGNISQGYTNKGQILGAGTGSFGNSQFIGYRVYHPYGSVMVFYHRHCPDNNFIFNKAVNAIAADGTELSARYYAQYRTFRTYGIEASHFFNRLLLTGRITRLFIAHPLYDQGNKMGYSLSLAGKYVF